MAKKSVERRKRASERAESKELVQKHHPIFLLANIPAGLSQDYEGYAVDFFMSTYVLLPKEPGIRRGFLDFLYPVWLQTDSSSPLVPAVVAVASCLLEVWSFLSTDRPLSLSRSNYIKAVVALRKSLQSTNEVGVDVLMAALVLDMYENLRSFFMLKPNNGPHVKGTTALLENKNRLPFAGELSQKVVLGARSHIVSRALTTKKSVPHSISERLDENRSVYMSPGIYLDELQIKVANLQAMVSGFDSCDKPSATAVSNTLNMAFELDEQLAAWIDTVPKNWIPTKVMGSESIPSSVREAGLYNNYCNVYKSIFVAYGLNSYHCSRIRLQITILACMGHKGSPNMEAASKSIFDVVQEQADSICASVPFHLGDRTTICRLGDRSIKYPHIEGLSTPDDHFVAATAFGGWFIGSKLLELISFKTPLRDGQRQWIISQLQRVARVYATKPPEAS